MLFLISVAFVVTASVVNVVVGGIGVGCVVVNICLGVVCVVIFILFDTGTNTVREGVAVGVVSCGIAVVK